MRHKPAGIWLDGVQVNRAYEKLFDPVLAGPLNGPLPVPLLHLVRCERPHLQPNQFRRGAPAFTFQIKVDKGDPGVIPRRLSG